MRAAFRRGFCCLTAFLRTPGMQQCVLSYALDSRLRGDDDEWKA
jgi:hypothetical protein